MNVVINRRTDELKKMKTLGGNTEIMLTEAEIKRAADECKKNYISELIVQDIKNRADKADMVKRAAIKEKASRVANAKASDVFDILEDSKELEALIEKLIHEYLNETLPKLGISIEDSSKFDKEN